MDNANGFMAMLALIGIAVALGNLAHAMGKIAEQLRRLADSQERASVHSPGSETVP